MHPLALWLAMTATNTPTISQESKDIEKVLQRYVEATRTYDVKTLDTLLDREYIEVSPLGEVDIREKVLSFYKEKGPSPDSIKIDELTIRYPSASVVVAIFCQTAHMKVQERSVDLAFRTTITLKKTHSDWRLYSSQFVGIRKKPAG